MKKVLKFKERSKYEAAKLVVYDGQVTFHDPYMMIVIEEESAHGQTTTRMASSSESDNTIATGLVLVKVKDKKASEDYLRANKINKVKEMEAVGITVLELPESMDFEDFKAAMMTTGIYETVEEDRISEEKTSMADPFESSQWVLGKIKASEAWSLIPPGAYGDVAVLDGSGFAQHEDMVNSYVLPYHAVNGNTNVDPANAYENHGTPCAGVIAANSNNNIGVKGLGDNKLKVQPIVIGYNASSSGSFNTSDLIMITGLNKAMSNPNCVAISMSFGSNAFKSQIYNAITSVRVTGRGGKGIPVFASAGNNGIKNTWKNYPASYDGVIAIGATASSDARASYSNYGSGLTISAPGTVYTVDRMNTDGYSIGNYTSFNGTSCASPVAAAVGALMVIANPSITEAQVKAGLILTSEKVGGYIYVDGKSTELGYGRVNMKAAIQYALSLASSEPVPTPTPTPEKHNFSITVSAPSTVVEGKPISVTYTVTTNHPELPAIPVNVSAKWSFDSTWSIDDEAAGVPTSVLLGGGVMSVNKTFSFTPSTTFIGTKYVTVKCDAFDEYQEISETDNIGIGQVIVTKAPIEPLPGQVDLAIELVSESPVVISGTTSAVIKYKLVNKGSVDITSIKLLKIITETFSSTGVIGSPIKPGVTVSYTSSLPSLFFKKGTNQVRFLLTEINGFATDSNSENNAFGVTIVKN